MRKFAQLINILKLNMHIRKKMSFPKITDPKKIVLMVDEFLKTRKNIQINQLAERLGEQDAMAGFTRRYKPITDVQKDLSQNILSEIKNLPNLIDFPRAVYTPAIEGADDDTEIIGPIAAKYLRKFTSKDADKVDGIRDNEGLYIGDTRIGMIGDNITVGEKEYQGTPGLWELITMKLPDDEVYDDDDYKNYADILVNTNALKIDNDSESRKPKSSKSWKWNHLLAQIWRERDKYEGKGVVIIPSDPNALLDRLDLLMASKGAGNTGVDNEIVSISDELKRQNVLDVHAYKKLMSSL